MSDEKKNTFDDFHDDDDPPKKAPPELERFVVEEPPVPEPYSDPMPVEEAWHGCRLCVLRYNEDHPEAPADGEKRRELVHACESGHPYERVAPTPITYGHPVYDGEPT